MDASLSVAKRYHYVSWAAGFIDGEGYIGATHIKPYSPQHKPRFHPRLNAGQTNRMPLERLQVLFGGSITQPRIREGRRPFWMWDVTGAKAVAPALTLLLPWLTVKLPQAELTLELCGRILAQGRGSGWAGGRRGLSDEEYEARAVLAARIREVTAV